MRYEDKEDGCGACCSCRDERIGVAELMNEYWFYKNMFEGTRLLKLNPSVYTSCSNTSREMDVRGSGQTQRAPLTSLDALIARGNLVRTLSLLPRVSRRGDHAVVLERRGADDDHLHRMRSSSLQRFLRSFDQAHYASSKGDQVVERGSDDCRHNGMNKSCTLQRSLSSFDQAYVLSNGDHVVGRRRDNRRRHRISSSSLQRSLSSFDQTCVSSNTDHEVGRQSDDRQSYRMSNSSLQHSSSSVDQPCISSNGDQVVERRSDDRLRNRMSNSSLQRSLSLFDQTHDSSNGDQIVERRSDDCLQDPMSNLSLQRSLSSFDQTLASSNGDNVVERRSNHCSHHQTISNSTLRRSLSSFDHTLTSSRVHSPPSSKVTAPKLVIPKHPLRRDSKLIGRVYADVKHSTSRQTESTIKSCKSLSELEFEEIQGFKELGFVFDKDNINPTIKNILPGLKDKKETDEDDNGKVIKRPYLSEAWRVQRVIDPPKLNWANRTSALYKKEQLKAWARTVASNVR